MGAGRGLGRVLQEGRKEKGRGKMQMDITLNMSVYARPRVYRECQCVPVCIPVCSSVHICGSKCVYIQEWMLV